MIRNQAKDKPKKSMVADNESGKSIESEVRTSSDMFLNKAQVSLILIANFVLDLQKVVLVNLAYWIQWGLRFLWLMY